MSNGSQVSWMNVVDEASSAHLKVSVYSCRTVAQMDLQEVVQSLNVGFERWGLPEKIKIDNGLPLVLPKQADIPTLAKLWWIGLGIEVIQNTPRCPQQNGAVECSQGVLYSWSNPSAQPTIEALQNRLEQESDFQRNHYRIAKRGGETRIKLYPELEQNCRIYDPNNFKMERIDMFLSQQVWLRTIKKNGELKFMGHWIYIGLKWAKEIVSITFDPQMWMSTHTLYFFLLSFVLFFVANSVLTALPIVSYGPQAILGIRVYTIPLEDFFYNFGMLGYYLFFYRLAGRRTVRPAELNRSGESA